MAVFNGPLTVSSPDELIATIEIVQGIACIGNDLGILEANVTGGNGPFRFDWSNGATTRQIADLDPGTYDVLVTDENGCTTTAFGSIAEPEEVMAEITTTDPGCINFINGQIQVDVVDGLAEPITYSVDGETFIDSPLILELDAGDYEVFVQDGFGCIYNVGMVTLNYINVLTTALADTITIVEGDETILFTRFSFEPVSVDWIPSEFLSCSDCANPIFQGDSTSVYSVIAEDEFGCRIEADVTIIVEPRLDNVYIPNVIKLNDTDLDAAWMPFLRDGETATISYRIYDRWGSIVAEKDRVRSDDPDLAWDGIWKSEPAQLGVYIYRLQILFDDSNEVLSFVGDLTVLN